LQHHDERVRGGLVEIRVVVPRVVVMVAGMCPSACSSQDTSGALAALGSDRTDGGYPGCRGMEGSSPAPLWTRVRVSSPDVRQTNLGQVGTRNTVAPDATREDTGAFVMLVATADYGSLEKATATSVGTTFAFGAWSLNEKKNRRCCGVRSPTSR
jgi:hypothetical protein